MVPSGFYVESTHTFLPRVSRWPAAAPYSCPTYHCGALPRGPPLSRGNGESCVHSRLGPINESSNRFLGRLCETGWRSLTRTRTRSRSLLNRLSTTRSCDQPQGTTVSWQTGRRRFVASRYAACYAVHKLSTFQGRAITRFQVRVTSPACLRSGPASPCTRACVRRSRTCTISRRRSQPRAPSKRRTFSRCTRVRRGGGGGVAGTGGIGCARTNRPDCSARPGAARVARVRERRGVTPPSRFSRRWQ